MIFFLNSYTISIVIQIKKPYVLFIGSDPRPERSKIAFGAASFIPADCVGYISDQASI